MRTTWKILAANGTNSHNFTQNTDESVEDINVTGIGYAFFSDTNWSVPTTPPAAGTMTWTGQQYYPTGVVQNIPVALVGSPAEPTNVVDFSVDDNENGFTFAGKCMAFSVVNAGISGSVGSIMIIVDRYTGGN